MTLWAEVSATPSIPPIPVPLEAYSAQIDDLLPRSQQRSAFRQHLADLLLPAERSKTLSAVANTERSAASRPRARSACPGSSRDCQKDTENVRFLTVVQAYRTSSSTQSCSNSAREIAALRTSCVRRLADQTRQQSPDQQAAAFWGQSL